MKIKLHKILDPEGQEKGRESKWSGNCIYVPGTSQFSVPLETSMGRGGEHRPGVVRLDNVGLDPIYRSVHLLTKTTKLTPMIRVRDLNERF